MKRYITYANVNATLVLLILFISSRASQLAMSDIMLFSTLLANIGVMYARKIKIDSSFALVIPAILLLVAQNYWQSGGQINMLRYVKLSTMIMIAYCTIKIVRFDFFKHFTKIVWWAILLSLPFYVWQQVSVQSLHAFGTVLNNLFPSIMDTTPYSQNILIYTIEFVDTHRNSGPMWEPGGFATVIVLALYFELLMNRFTLNKRTPVYLLGVFLTISTTGYMLTMILAFVLVMKLIKEKSPKIKYSLYIVVLPACIGAFAYIFFATDIMYNKIMFLFDDQMAKLEETQHVENLNLDVKFSLGRFGSLLVDLQSIRNNWLFGRGYDDDLFRNGEFGSFNLTNGLSNFVARLGIIGLIWLIVSLNKSGKIITYALSGSKNANLLKIIVPFIAFSNPVLFTPFYIMLSLFFIPFKPVNHKIFAS